MYNPYPNFEPVGWTCPKCGRVYSPTQSYCLYCNDRRVTYVTTTNPEWIYKENKSTDVVDDWWNQYQNISLDNVWRDIISNAILEEE